jgi:hypothetical protein
MTRCRAGSLRTNDQLTLGAFTPRGPAHLEQLLNSSVNYSTRFVLSGGGLDGRRQVVRPVFNGVDSVESYYETLFGSFKVRHVSRDDPEDGVGVVD